MFFLDLVIIYHGRWFDFVLKLFYLYRSSATFSVRELVSAIRETEKQLDIVAPNWKKGFQHLPSRQFQYRREIVKKYLSSLGLINTFEFYNKTTRNLTHKD